MSGAWHDLLSDRLRWEKIAAVAPYYAVMTEPRFLGTPGGEARQAFFDSGEDYVDRLLTRISDFTGGVGIRRVLELGCGPGRLALAFARRGFSVTAVDIAPAMLALARENAAGRGTPDIEFQSLEDFLGGDATYDLVNATLVLQQIAPQAGNELLRRLIARVAPGGCLHVQVPYRSERGYRSRVVTAVRRQVPALNRAVNRRRHRPADFPVLVPQVYSLDDVFALIREADTDVRKVELTRENELEVATIVARRKVAESVAPPQPVATAAEAPPADADTTFIDVRELMRTISIDELHRRAEEYFASAPSFDAQLAKPFSSPADAPAMLINLGVLIRGMHVLQGHTVLDFGAGTGWLSRSLTQMGCAMIVADVSETALRIAREDFERAGLMNSRFPPRFLHYGGQWIDLPDASVDRIICFDAFHHVPNPDTVLREFARILRPGGIAAFSEPGPEHSRSAMSQFEMRTYGVLENDVDIHAIWTSARAFGFADLQLAVYTGTPSVVSLRQYDELLRGGDTLLESAHAMRNFLANVRLFFLRRAGEERVDSRTASALASSVHVTLRGDPRAGVPIPVTATVVNTGTAVWLPAGTATGAVMLGCHLYSGDTLVRFDHHWQALGTDQEIEPGGQVTVDFDLPPLEPGSYDLELDCVAHEVTWFAQVGSRPARLHLDL